MKSYRFFSTLLSITLIVSNIAVAQGYNFTLKHYSNSTNPTVCSGTPGWCSQNFSVCGQVYTKFQIYFQHIGNIGGTCNANNPNNFRFSISFFRDGVLLAPVSVANGMTGYYPAGPLNSILTQPGNYYAEVKFEKRKCVPYQWVTVGTYRSNTIVVSAVPATPDFKIKGVSASDVNVPTVNFSNGEIIEIDASGTSCESKYFVGVWETGIQWWERTFDYEWGQWFTGQAPASINLQNLATNQSHYSFFYGTASRKGQILFGGLVNAISLPPNLPFFPYQQGLIGQQRRYTVEVSTSEPIWKTKKIQIVIQ